MYRNRQRRLTVRAASDGDHSHHEKSSMKRTRLLVTTQVQMLTSTDDDLSCICCCCCCCCWRQNALWATAATSRLTAMRCRMRRGTPAAFARSLILIESPSRVMKKSIWWAWNCQRVMLCRWNREVTSFGREMLSRRACLKLRRWYVACIQQVFRAVIISTHQVLGGVSHQPPIDNIWRLSSAAVCSRLCTPELSDLTELVEAADNILFPLILKNNHFLSSL